MIRKLNTLTKDTYQNVFFVYLIQGLQGLAGLPGDEGGMGEPVCNAFIRELLQSLDVEFQFFFQFTTNLL